MTPRDKALDRTRKLCRLAENQQGTPEGDTAKGLADAMAERWKFTPEELAPVEGVEEIPIYRVVFDFEEPKQLHARAFLLNALAAIGGCASTYRMTDEVSLGRVYGDDEVQVNRVVEAFHAVERYLVDVMVTQRMWLALSQSESRGLKTGHIARIKEGVRRNWTMTFTMALLDIWKTKSVELKEGASAEAPADPGSALAVQDRSLATQGDLDRIKKAAGRAAAEKWEWDWEAFDAVQRMPWPKIEAPASAPVPAAPAAPAAPVQAYTKQEGDPDGS